MPRDVFYATQAEDCILQSVVMVREISHWICESVTYHARISVIVARDESRQTPPSASPPLILMLLLQSVTDCYSQFTPPDTTQLERRVESCRAV